MSYLSKKPTMTPAIYRQVEIGSEIPPGPANISFGLVVLLPSAVTTKSKLIQGMSSKLTMRYAEKSVIVTGLLVTVRMRLKKQSIKKRSISYRMPAISVIILGNQTLAALPVYDF
jgi:hypothetical protein